MPGGSCEGEFVCIGCDESWKKNGDYYIYDSSVMINPSDVSASGMYISNGNNRIVGNILSGGSAGIAFITMPYPLFSSLGQDLGDMNPQNRPLLEFDGNIAHSSGFYWSANCAACLYAGGELYFDDDQQSYVYVTGKSFKDSMDEDGNEQFNNLTNVKLYLCKSGILYYGDRSIVRNYEFYDGFQSEFTVGTHLLQNAIINARSNNEYGLETVMDSRKGWPFYDTSSQQFLDNVIFRNFDYGETIIYMNDKNDEFCVQGIGGVRNIKYENCPDYSHYIVDEWCGEPCSERDGENPNDDDDYYYESQGSRVYAFYGK